MRVTLGQDDGTVGQKRPIANNDSLLTAQMSHMNSFPGKAMNYLKSFDLTGKNAVITGGGGVLGGAIAEAASLPAATADAVLAVARRAFVQGFRVTAIAGAIVVLLLAVMAFFQLRPKEEEAAE